MQEEEKKNIHAAVDFMELQSTENTATIFNLQRFLFRPCRHKRERFCQLQAGCMRAAGKG